MVKNTTGLIICTVFLFILGTKPGDFVQLYKASLEFVCDFDNNTLKLVINNGFVKEQVIKCLDTYNTAESLVLSSSRLKTIPKYLSILKRLVSLDLSYNKITTVSFSSLENICKNLKQLCLDHNEIRRLQRGDLDCLNSLEKLYLSNNNLQVIENGTFNKKLKKIDYIHFVNNSLTVIDSSLFSRVLISKKIHITLNASWNRITEVTNSENITIEDISPSTTIDVILTHNNITTVDTEYYLKMFNVTLPVPQLFNLWNSGIDARFNPFICDCALYPLASALRKFYTMDPDNPVFSVTCGTPVSLEGMMIRKVQPVQFNCSISEGCPDSCTCTKTIAIGLITVECSNQYGFDDLPVTCPLADKININIKSGELTRLSSREYLRNVTVFDVSQCAVADIDPSLVGELEGRSNTSIYLHDNNLESIPKTFQKFRFSKGQILTLDGNPFNCDCHTLWMKQWLLSNTDHVYQQNKIICENGPGRGRPMLEVPDNKFLCQTSLAFVDILFITIGSLFGIILLFSVTACKIKSIQILMITHFDLCKYCFRKKKHRRLLYDIFIPHSCEDDHTIDIIVKYLEDHTPPYKVCIGERNFEPGKTISENILVAIESSHTTLLVISNNFLRSAWCNMEFREAHMRFIRDRNINMVLIILGELDDTLVYKELRLYMESHVYIRFSDEQFWAKLLQSLPIMIQNESDETSPLFIN